MIQDYQFPEWDKTGRVHDWRNYISKRLREMWESFTDEQKQVIAENAEGIASNEDWD